MPDDNDEYLDIELDDVPDSQPSEGVLDIVFEDSALPSPTPPTTQVAPASSASKAPPTANPAAEDDLDLPMTAGGVCSRCGYALRPLEDRCPRCSQGGPVPPPPQIEHDEPLPAPGLSPEAPLPAARGGPGCCSAWTIAGGLLLLAVIGGLIAWLWATPGQRAGREYGAGLRAQMAGDFEKARNHYRKALELDPKMGLAAFSLGTTYLRFGDPAISVAIEKLMEQAVWGQTTDLDEADRWFREAIRIGQQLPPGTRLMDEKISTPPKLRSYSHVCLALTAYVRANAALQADQYDDGFAWYRVVQTEVQAALTDDPENTEAQRMSREPAPTPPTPGPL